VDSNRNGFFDAPFDVALGTGSFGNVGQTGVAQILFSTANIQTLVTSARAAAESIPNRYFVTYNIAGSATPDRTLGAWLQGSGDLNVSLPGGAQTLSLPNTMSGATLPFIGKLRSIIPAPQLVTVNFSPVFSSLLGGSTQQSLPAPTLGSNISASDTLIPVSTVTTAGLPPSGYAVIDNEIIFYSALVPTALTGVQRGQLGSAAAAHNNGAVIGTQYAQSDRNVAFMKMQVYVNDVQGFNVRWFKLRLNRLQPAGLIGADTDISTVRLYRDGGAPGLDRNPANGLISPTDVLMAQRSFGQGETAAQCTLNLSDINAGNTYYILISTTPTDYFLVFDIDPTAVYDHVVGARIPNAASFIIGAQTEGDGVHTVDSTSFPAQSPTAVLRATLDTLQVKTESLMPLTHGRSARHPGHPAGEDGKPHAPHHHAKPEGRAGHEDQPALQREHRGLEQNPPGPHRYRRGWRRPAD
jgi:hypothetical protein